MAERGRWPGWAPCAGGGPLAEGGWEWAAVGEGSGAFGSPYTAGWVEGTGEEPTGREALFDGRAWWGWR